MQIKKVDAEMFDAAPGRFILVGGHQEGAPTCPFGNQLPLVGLDTISREYVRYTRSVYKRIKDKTDQQTV
jgi:hypothetical protein